MMKRMFMIAIFGAIFGCTSPEKTVGVAGQPSGESRSIAAEPPVDSSYRGTPGNFTYQYKGTLEDFNDLVLDKHSRVPMFSRDAMMMFDLSKHRFDLLNNNLFDTGVDEQRDVDCAKIMNYPHRTATGNCYFYNQPVFAEQVHVGDNHQRFGRNVDPTTSNDSQKTYGIMDPDPRLISQKLFTRREGKTIEADIVNVLAAAWLQAENHDWFSHGKNMKKSIEGKDLNAQDINSVAATKVDPTTNPQDKNYLNPNGYDKAYRNVVTHWWDASHIYGSDEATIRKVRTNPETKQYPIPGGKIAVHKDRHLYYDDEGLPITGFNDNWWLGLDLIHTLFAMEHNFVAGELKKRYPEMNEEIIFQTARLIVAGLIAKIHTVEWTPALLDNKVLALGMYSNWHGLRSVVGADSIKVRGLLDTLSKRAKHSISGLVGPGTLDLYNVPFTLTEEFVAVYRMHPLVPEFVTPRNSDGSLASAPLAITDATYSKVKALLEDPKASLKWMYGFGTGHPGALALHNYPTFLQNLKAERNTGVSSAEENSKQVDMGMIDIIRDRERNVPRYNDFRASLKLATIHKFEDLTDDAEDVSLLKEIYGDGPNGVAKLDLIVGTLAEKDRFAGYGFGNTPFYVFALMASRRLMSDPFFSDYYTPKVYTQFGIDWVENQTMVDVITRHFPELKPQFKGVINAFKPWQPVNAQVTQHYKEHPMEGAK